MNKSLNLINPIWRIVYQMTCLSKLYVYMRVSTLEVASFIILANENLICLSIS